MLLLFLWPSTAGKVYLPNEFPAHPPPPLPFCPTLMGLTPGVGVKNWVKLRPLRGRSLTGFVLMTVPSSEVVDSTVDRLAVTVTTWVEDPTLNVKSSFPV